jgi:hypothetical protein
MFLSLLVLLALDFKIQSYKILMIECSELSVLRLALALSPPCFAIRSYSEGWCR